MGLESKDQKADFNRGGINYKNKSNQTVYKKNIRRMGLILNLNSVRRI